MPTAGNPSRIPTPDPDSLPPQRPDVVPARGAIAMWDLLLLGGGLAAFLAFGLYALACERL
jgi:hypothetical protein